MKKFLTAAINISLASARSAVICSMRSRQTHFLYFLSNILSLPIHVFAAVSLVLSVLRIADALNDPITGLVIDNIHTKWGKFKPAILVGGVVSVIFYLILFGNVGTGTAYVIFLRSRVCPLGYQLWHQ